MHECYTVLVLVEVLRADLGCSRLSSAGPSDRYDRVNVRQIGSHGTAGNLQWVRSALSECRACAYRIA